MFCLYGSQKTVFPNTAYRESMKRKKGKFGLRKPQERRGNQIDKEEEGQSMTWKTSSNTKVLSLT